MSARNATDAVMAVLDDAHVQTWIGDRQYDALCGRIERAIAEHAIAAKDAEIARLRDALAPFAEISKHFNDRESGLIHGWHSTKVGSSEISVEHVHAARAAMARGGA